MSKLRTVETTALYLTVLLRRSSQNRARLSGKTIRLVSGRTTLKLAFINMLAEALAQHSVSIVELDTGGYALIESKSLEAAKPITAKKFGSEDELRLLQKRRPLDDALLEDELGGDREFAAENE
jgi:hypothetical protein